MKHKTNPACKPGKAKGKFVCQVKFGDADAVEFRIGQGSAHLLFATDHARLCAQCSVLQKRLVLHCTKIETQKDYDHAVSALGKWTKRKDEHFFDLGNQVLAANALQESLSSITTLGKEAEALGIPLFEEDGTTPRSFDEVAADVRKRKAN